MFSVRINQVTCLNSSEVDDAVKNFTFLVVTKPVCQDNFLKSLSLDVTASLAGSCGCIYLTLKAALVGCNVCSSCPGLKVTQLGTLVRAPAGSRQPAVCGWVARSDKRVAKLTPASSLH